jgi:uncharacterized protein (UPF0332 family)
MLNAARAALSERDLHARTHGGTWAEFHQQFVEPGTIDRSLVARAREAEKRRHLTDYEAARFSRDQAEASVADADALIAAVSGALQ